jgi:hypothetical protein
MARKDLLHRRRLAEDLGTRPTSSGAPFWCMALVERPADQFERLVDVEGLGQVFEGAALEGGTALSRSE